ncbi:YbaB/EbfC family nucleoid-associated protein [Streptomyces sp. NPDC001770]
MSSGYQDQLRAVMGQLEERREQLLASRESIAARRVKTTSKDRMITVELGSQSEIRELKFNTEQYRSMAPAELSKALVEVLEKARTQLREELLAEAAPMLDLGRQMRESMLGGSPLASLIGDVGRLWPETRPESALPADGSARPWSAATTEDDERDG